MSATQEQFTPDSGMREFPSVSIRDGKAVVAPSSDRQRKKVADDDLIAVSKAVSDRVKEAFRRLIPDEVH